MEGALVSNSESEAVILEGASQTANKQTNARMHWFFTFNNYNSEDINILRKVFNELCYMYAFQEETGESGTHHLQGIISMKKRARWTEFGLQTPLTQLLEKYIKKRQHPLSPKSPQTEQPL